MRMQQWVHTRLTMQRGHRIVHVRTRHLPLGHPSDTTHVSICGRHFATAPQSTKKESDQRVKAYEQLCSLP